MFRFKQFSVDQAGCAMKINTDGVLLGALTEADQPPNILDIGTGTGVIALMLAQKYHEAKIDAVEIDQSAAETANRNFSNSPFAERMRLYAIGFEQFFEANPGKKYDLIVSNPPFFINSLKSPEVKKELARHTDKAFFENLVKNVSDHLNPAGSFWLVLPVSTADLVILYATEWNLYPSQIINVTSFPHSETHRVILKFGLRETITVTNRLSIYKSINSYSEEYKVLLQPYFIAL